jgi:hypothetical protein
MILRRELVAGLTTLLVPVVAIAQTAVAPNPAAEALNDQGKELYKARDYQGAAAKFREAIGLTPDARYYFNLCATLEKTGDYDGALEACDAVYANAPSDELKGKTGARAAEIRKAKRERDSQPQPVPGDPNLPNPQPLPQPLPPPEEAPRAQPDYRWGFGGALGVMAGNVDDEFDQGAGWLLNLNADRLFMPKANVGLRLDLDFGQLNSVEVKDLDGAKADMTFFQLGAGIYKHFKIGDHFAITPSVSLLLGGWVYSEPDAMEVDSSTDPTVVSIGGRLGVTADYTFGGGKHAIYFGPMLQVYSGGEVTDDSGAADRSASGGGTFAFMLGYTARFQTGDIPGFQIVTLE